MICNEPTIKDKQLMIPDDSHLTKPSWLVMQQSFPIKPAINITMTRYRQNYKHTYKS